MTMSQLNMSPNKLQHVKLDDVVSGARGGGGAGAVFRTEPWDNASQSYQYDQVHRRLPTRNRYNVADSDLVDRVICNSTTKDSSRGGENTKQNTEFIFIYLQVHVGSWECIFISSVIFFYM